MPVASLPQTFTILVDKREQLPWDFTRVRKPVLHYILKPAILTTGDYQLELPEEAPPSDRIVLERKTLSDLYSTVGQNRERFVREMERMAAFGYAAVVIEASLHQVADPSTWLPHHSALLPKSLVASLLAWSQRFGVHMLFAGSRQLAEPIAYRMLARWVRDHG